MLGFSFTWETSCHWFVLSLPVHGWTPQAPWAPTHQRFLENSSEALHLLPATAGLPDLGPEPELSPLMAPVPNLLIPPPPRQGSCLYSQPHNTAVLGEAVLPRLGLHLALALKSMGESGRAHCGLGPRIQGGVRNRLCPREHSVLIFFFSVQNSNVFPSQFLHHRSQ